MVIDGMPEEASKREYGHDRDGHQCAPEVCGGVSYDPCLYDTKEIEYLEKLAEEEDREWRARHAQGG